MYVVFNHSKLVINHKTADSVAIKGKDSAVMIYQLTDGTVTINTDDFSAGNYWIQFFKADEVIAEDQLQVKQNLKFVTSGYNPQSDAEKILEAINAVLAGRATSGQYHVKVGEKELSYCSFDELMKWRNYYRKEVAKEQGKPSQIRG